MSEFSVAELIDCLPHVSTEEWPVRTNAWGWQHSPRGLLEIHEPDPRVPDAMEELIRHGPASLAALCAHVDDGRPTQAFVECMFGGFDFSAEYDFAPYKEKVAPQGVVLHSVIDRKVPKFTNLPAQSVAYRRTVGDLCFDLIGLIVNRRYRSVRYQPTAIVVVNSPVLCPALAMAVRDEWAHVTRQEHQKGLVRELISPDKYGRDAGAAECIWRYYPHLLPEAVRRRLAAPTFDENLVTSLVKELLTEADATFRQQEIHRFADQHGQAARDGLAVYLWNHRYVCGAPGETIDVAFLLQQVIGSIDPRHPPCVSAPGHRWTEQFIESLTAIPSPEIAAAVLEEFRRRTGNAAPVRNVNDYIAEACIDCLAGKGHDAEFIRYFRRRMRQMQDKEHAEAIEHLLTNFMETAREAGGMGEAQARPDDRH